MKKQSFKSMADIVSEFVQENNLEDGLFRVRIYDAWDKAVEAELGPFFLPQQIPSLTVSRSFANGVLKCTMASSVVRSQLRARTAFMASSINQSLGGEYVVKIILL